MIRKTLIAVAAVAALAVAAPTAGAWQSDTFQSPSGNLLCKYRYDYDSITCGARNSQMVIHMTSRGRPSQGSRLSWDRGTYWPVLHYGWKWNEGKPISCTSLFGGMKCQNAAGWYFMLSRSGVVVGRYGSDYYRF